jgi:ubiquinone/menaquinone biosynthesis C-methylase UbiE
LSRDREEVEVTQSTTIGTAFSKKQRCADMVRKLKPYLQHTDRLIDIGCGSAHIAKALKELGHLVTLLDIKNNSYFSEFSPVIYDGNTIPFADNTFDVSLLLTVLHHINDPVATLAEAARVSKRIIVIEDLYDGWVQKYLTFAMDSCMNLEFFGHPHSNKTGLEWKSVFKAMNLRILDQKTTPFWGFFTSGTFYLQKGD